MSHAPRFHRLAVNDLRRETADAISLSFMIPKELEGDYSFSPGQYLTCAPRWTARKCRRSYSICSGPTMANCASRWKKVDGGGVLELGRG